jgi:hypothetical protein
LDSQACDVLTPIQGQCFAGAFRENWNMALAT